MPEILTMPAICLKVREYRDSSQILQFYSADYGKLDVLAKGMKKPKSRLAGAAQLLSISQLQVRTGSGFYYLQQYESLQSFSNLHSSMEALSCAYVSAECLYQLSTPHQEESEFYFAALRDALVIMDRAATLESAQMLQASLQALISLMVHLLVLSGLWPELDACVLSGLRLEAMRSPLLFSHSLGGIVSEAHAQEAQHQAPPPVRVSAKTLRYLNTLLEDAPVIDIETDTQLRALRFLLYYYQQALQLEFRSVDWMWDCLRPGLLSHSS